MAKENLQNTSSVETNVFIKGMSKDLFTSYTPKDNWYNARNAANNSVDGDLAVIGNEPANLQCASVPYTIIGTIHRYADQWILFSTDDINSEIGLFDESKCEYTTLVNDPCLSFNRKHLITGAAKENYDCTWQVYWADGNNPDRTLNINDIPWIKIIVSPPGADCIEYENTTKLDCEKLRLAPLVQTPCVELTRAEDGGQLRNGSYQAYIAYVENEQKVTDYIGVSNVQSLFDHSGTAGSLRITVTNLDKNFEYYELVILSNNQQNIVAKRIGIYSTEQSSISIDYIDQSLITIPLEVIPLRSPAYEKSSAMYVVNDWLIRSEPTEQFDFNYQPIANQIKANWVVAEYPASYYYKGGNKTTFMRDERYAFFIRWIYNTGERSSSYHIPGREARINGFNQFGDIIDELQINNSINTISPGEEFNFQVYNTATVTSTGLNEPTGDGGIIIAKGDMAYWQSTEKYPATRPDIWSDLCGKYIRHHQMPSEETGPELELATNNGNTIRILGVEFSNIGLPTFNDGTVIPNIVGYEILRGSREGQKSILAKGIFKNMRKYNIPDSQNLTNSSIEGLYPNYPYNDLRDDIYFTAGNGNTGFRTDGCDSLTSSLSTYPPLQGFKQDVFTFHSPELMFKKPFLNAYETRFYGEVKGSAEGYFIKSENHPKNKLLRNSAAFLSLIVGVGYAIGAVTGTKKRKYNGFGYSNTPGDATAVPAYSLSLTGAPGYNAAIGGLELGASQNLDLGSLVALAGGPAAYNVFLNLNQTAFRNLNLLTGVVGGAEDLEFEFKNPESNLPTFISSLLATQISMKNISVGAQEIIDLFYNLSSFQDYAYKHNSHGFYNDFDKIDNGVVYRSKNNDSNYIGSSFQQFDNQYKINNLFRPMTVAVSTDRTMPIPKTTDNSRYVIGGDVNKDEGDKFIKDPETIRKTNISAMYGALKFAFDNQYGQIEGIKQVQMKGCIEYVDLSIPQRKFTSKPIFTGDVYINRYTEKTIMPIFTDFLNSQPDEYPYDYLKRINIPYPRYWMDTRKFDTSRISNSLLSFNANTINNILPNDSYYLDRGDSSCITSVTGLFKQNDPNPLFILKYAYMYTHVNGIQDFFVESEINLSQRDWDDTPRFRHYDIYEYNNIDDLFHADIIREGNFYKYDYSLSASRFITNLASFGNIQPRDYDPYVAETCYTNYPKRLIYSLQAQLESKKDYWRVYLANNYKDFRDKVNIIKPINKSGAIIFFPYQSPQMFQGLDTLQTDLGTKLTIGDGGLFSQPFQNIVNSDLSNEYGSCESARSVVNTPYGLFFISQAQGKIFHYTGGLDAISNVGMKWWFNKYLPSVLIRQFPEIEETKFADNPVIGIGCQTVYDVNDDIVYFMKKDYAVKPQFISNMKFDIINERFIFTTDFGAEFVVTIGDPIYFEDCSWTVSYDPKIKAWISFHDWHPELSLPSINHFLTTKTEVVTTPSCPPDYNFNPDTKRCEKTETIIKLASISREEVGAIFGDSDNCTLDIVIAMDTSGSTLAPSTNPIWNTQRQFVQNFLQSPEVSSGMAANRIQVGFTVWNTASVSMNPSGFSMSNTITPAAVDTWYTTVPPIIGAGTDICLGMSVGDGVLLNKASSELGDRSAIPGFKSILIVITDATSASCDYLNPVVGCDYTSKPNYEVYGILCQSLVFNNGVFSLPVLSAIQIDILNAVTCNQPTNQFLMVPNIPFLPVQPFPENITSYISTQIAGSVCSPCGCPDGYTLVYKDNEEYYTLPDGECMPGEVICRKVSCDCPEPAFDETVPAEEGECPDIYGIGNPDYVNLNPKLCYFFSLITTPPSYLQSGLWRHNSRCDLFANYYGVSYPWEVEFIETTGQNVNTVRSVEYQLESYVYKGDLINACGDDRWHDLDFNFNESIIYNTEQISGLLRLELSPKDDPFGLLQYPIIGPSDIRILYSKEEQKYRFNQFWDITNDRGEFTNSEQRLFVTRLNGYIKDLNPINLDYLKTPDQRKKFRHYANNLLLRRTNSGNRKMLLKLVNTKLNLSFR